MSEFKPLDGSADVLPVGLQPTPFGEVWQALQQVAASVWNADPSVYRAGMAWLWYAVNHPDDLASDSLRALLVAALISEQAPMVKDWQTNAELVEYLRIWRTYSPTYAKLEAIFATFGARVEVRPISDAESQGVVPVADRRLAFYLRVEEFDAARPLTLDEVYQIAVRATPLGSRPVPYYALVGSSDVFAGPASAGMARVLWASEPAVSPPMSFVVVDGATGAIVHGFNQVLSTYELPSVVLESDYETYELPSVSLVTPKLVIGIPLSTPVEAFWFTDNGRAETTNKTLGLGNRLYLDSGEGASSSTYDRYLGASPVAFTQVDGNMVPPDSDPSRTYIRNLSNYLNLIVSGTSPIREVPVWSVQVAKLFVLSYANTQLPDVQIELPINDVGAYGTVITLPTMTGEYESGGKTWKPSAWDIGAFGSSYSLTGDVVAHLVFTEVIQYTEVKLYMASGDKQAQKQVTSGFTGNVNATYCYQLYVDDQLTTPWTGYDYSNNYELGNYSGGVWVPWTRTSVSSLPATYTSDSTQWKMAFILMDNGFLWLASNVSGSGYMSYPSTFITVRIYPKGKQIFPLFPYTSSMGKYDNSTISGEKYISWRRYPDTSYGASPSIPVFIPVSVYKSGMIEDKSLLVNAKAFVDSTNLRTNKIVSSYSCSSITFTFDKHIYKGWFRTDHADTPSYINSGTQNTLYDDDGNTIPYEEGYVYTALKTFRSSGDASGSDYITASQRMYDVGGNVGYGYTNGSVLTAAYVWYLKELRYIDCNFGDSVTIPDRYTVDCVKCSKLFVKSSDISADGATNTIYFEYLGENEFCEDKETSWFGAKVNPCIEMFGFSNPATFGGFRATFDSSRSGYATSAQATELNSGGYFVKGSTTLNSSYSSSTYAEYMRTNPMMFRLYAGGTLVDYHFMIQHSVWSFENGVFSWLGNDTDYSDLAYWYKSAPNVRIQLKPIWRDILAKFGDTITIPDGYTVDSVKCTRLHLKASSVSYDSSLSYDVEFEFSGENLYCDDTNTALVGKGVKPCLSIFANSNTNKTGYTISSTSSSITGVSSVSASKINTDGYFVKGSVTCSTASYVSSRGDALRDYPASFRMYNASGSSVGYYFNVQQSLWSFQNGQFTWNGDVTDPNDLAFWYANNIIRIRLMPV